jgi:hypothetical protein
MGRCHYLGSSVPSSILLLLLQSMFRSGEETDKRAGKQEKNDTEETQDFLEVGQTTSGVGESREKGIVSALAFGIEQGCSFCRSVRSLVRT